MATTEEKARYWSASVVPLRNVAENIDLLLADEGNGQDPQILREMLEEARDTITQCVG